jgi:hypothetical protein
MGGVKSEKKAAACRENGKKGGRPPIKRAMRAAKKAKRKDKS